MARIMGHVIVKIMPPPREPNGKFGESCKKG